MLFIEKETHTSKLWNIYFFCVCQQIVHQDHLQGLLQFRLLFESVIWTLNNEQSQLTKLLCWKQLPCFLIYTSRHFTPGAHQTESFSVQGSPCPKLPQQSGRYFWDQCIVFWSQCLSSVLQAMIKIDLISANLGIIYFFSSKNINLRSHESVPITQSG